MSAPVWRAGRGDEGGLTVPKTQNPLHFPLGHVAAVVLTHQVPAQSSENGHNRSTWLEKGLNH